MFSSAKNLPGLLLMVLILTCINCKKQTPGTEEEVSTQKIDSIPIVNAAPAKQPLPALFPFGNDLSSFDLTQALGTEAGDCITRLREYRKDALRIVTDSTNCHEYGIHNQYFLLDKDALEQVHIFEYYPQYDPSGESVIYIATETVYVLSQQPPKSYVRTDTLLQPEPGQMKTDFETDLIPDPDALQEDLRVELASLEDTVDNDYDFSFIVSTNENSDSLDSRKDIFLISESWKYPVWINEGSAVELIPKEEYKDLGIPKAAVFSIDSKHNNKNYIYYGLIEGSELMIYLRVIDVNQGPDNNFGLHKMESLEQQSPKPSYYLCYIAGESSEEVLMLAFDENDNALWAEFKGSTARQILVKKEEKITVKADRPLEEHFYEIFNDGYPVGTFRLATTDNWRHAYYQLQTTAAEQIFSMDQESIKGERTYHTSPCF
ncbi:hypothetical protein PP178_05420 [Zeaxanthinibacter sp. PT1]|uniref:hypothetical protein n=1 Tax=Zeaxanthinibacter TaxID=561554 RepID=UPI00234B8477|nr:hypothetical protein [Zeaxanthinibacter sp. PT1]MDC6350983.1 hypothetical protein [Zeaxanthinibacter sp. PT1]